jgi:predicted DNA-binding protein
VQLNLHVPRDRERLLGRLESAARRLGRPKNQVVLDAIEHYLDEADPGRRAGSGVPTFRMGDVAAFERGDLYADRVDD